MKYLLDTDTIIYFLNKNSSVKARMGKEGLKNISISIITLFELYFGAYNSHRIKENLNTINRLRNVIHIFQLNDSILNSFGKTKTFLKKAGELIGDFDLVIATTALAHDLTLITNNVSHFQRIPSLRIENWL
jgi:tRNA(fMet)-specific endonuclease VapC